MKQLRILIFAIAVAIGFSASGQRVLYILSQGTDMKSQNFIPYNYDTEFIPDSIRKIWDQDQHIVAGAFTYHGLQLVTSNHPGWGNQKYVFSKDYPTDFINEMMSKGFTITELSCDGNQWFTVATEVTPAKQQVIFSFDDPETPEQRAELDARIKELAEQKYFITDVACAGGLWSVVTTYNPDIIDQIYDFPVAAQDISDYFMRNQVQGYRISAADYGPGHYLCVMTKTAGVPKAQALLPGVENPNEVMRGFWDKHFAITHVAH